MAMGTSDERWWFGFGDDLLISERFEDDDPQANVRAINIARIRMFLADLNVEAQDHPRGPTSILKAAKTGHDDLIKTLAKHFADKPNLHEFFRHRLPEDLGAGLEEAYAFEMLNKLGEVVRRSKQTAVREILLLENVPEGVDDYMAEAAACFRYGFDKACLAVCRTALEEMLKKRIECDHGKWATQTYDESRKRWVDKDLRTLILGARREYGPKQQRSKYLNDQLVGFADQIRRWGNGAVHGKSDIPRGVVESRAQKALLYSKQILHHLWSR